MKKLLSMTLAMAMLFSLLAGCGGDSETSSSDTTTTTGDTSSTTSSQTVTAGLSAEPDGVVAGTSAISIITSDFISLQFPGDYAGGSDVYGSVYDPLFWSPSGNMQDITGLLVDTWTVSDDYLTVELNLLEDVYFANGNNLTAQSVIGSFDYHVYERNDTIASNLLGYEATGDYQVTLTFALPNVNFITELCSFHKAIFDPTLYEEMGNIVDAAYMCGSGPYYISDYAIGDYFILTAKEDHWNEDRQAHIETVTCKVITNSTTALNSMMSGEGDAFIVSNYESMEQLLTVDSVNVITSESPMCYSPYWLNSGTDALCPYLSNPRVREALSMMINVEELALVIGGQYSVVGVNAFTAAIDYEHDRVYDPDGGLAILAEEGIAPSDIVLTALATSGNSNAFSNLQAQLMNCGITLNFIAQDVPAVMTAGFNGEWDVWSEAGGISYYSMSNPLNVLMGADAAFDVVKDEEVGAKAASLVSSAFSATSIEEQYADLAELAQLLDENFIYLCTTGGKRWYSFSDRIANPTYHYSTSVWQIWDAWIAE